VYNHKISGWEFNTIDNKEVQIGDVICKTRNGHTFNPNSGYESHCDIVVRIEGSTVSVIGGNVGNSVSLVKIQINNQGMIAANINSDYIGVLS
jgi:hypothetical protein